MTAYNPTYGARETAKNVRGFVKDHMQIFWSIWKPLLPFVIACSLVDAVISAVYFSNSALTFSLFSVFAYYFTAVLIITWHRVIIDGPDSFTPMSAFKPKRHEWGFIGLWLALFFIGMGLLLIPIGLSVPFGPIVMGVVSILAVLGAIFVGLRLSFLLPAKAVDRSLTFKEGFRLSKGYIWKFINASFLATILTILLMGLYALCVGTLSSFLLVSIFGENIVGLVPSLIFFAVMLPIQIYFMPLITIMGVSTLSNYYRHASEKEKTVTPRAASSTSQ